MPQSRHRTMEFVKSFDVSTEEEEGEEEEEEEEETVEADHEHRWAGFRGGGFRMVVCAGCGTVKSKQEE